jgi:P-type Cu+ transporter
MLKEVFNKKDYLTKTIIIEGMSCASCAKAIENGLKKTKEIIYIKVNLLNHMVTIKVHASISDQVIKKTIENIGYKAVKIS